MIPSDEQPSQDCPLCPRLLAYRLDNRARYPDFFNAPVPSFGPLDARLLVVGLAPGVKGANRTGRPFTGDYAGKLLYETLIKYGFALGHFDARPDDGLRLTDCRVTNAVRCVPPENRPTPAETTTCNQFLQREINRLLKLEVIVALGSIAHGAVLKAIGLKAAPYKFGHGALHRLPNRLSLVDSYHCSRLNTNTGRLTDAMFHSIFKEVRALL